MQSELQIALDVNASSFHLSVYLSQGNIRQSHFSYNSHRLPNPYRRCAKYLFMMTSLKQRAAHLLDPPSSPSRQQCLSDSVPSCRDPAS